MTRQLVALRHLPFEDLDGFAPLFEAQGFALRYIETPVERAFVQAALDADLLVVLGGPIGVYDREDYPFLDDEIDVVRARLLAGKPVLGICLGAQIMAAALGAKVYPGRNGKELGWSALSLTAAGMRSPLAALAPGQPVLHWHGDTFDLPEGAELLAGTERYPNQAFAWGRHALALQFHIEVTAPGLERWWVGHALEIALTDGVAVPALRRESGARAGGLEDARNAIVQYYRRSFSEHDLSQGEPEPSRTL